MRAFSAGDGVLEVEQGDRAAGREPFAGDGNLFVVAVLVGVGVDVAALSGTAGAGMRSFVVGGG